jgi:hypothetical protein
VDEVGRILLDKIVGLIAQRPDFDADHFFASLGLETPSWRSEFFSGKRTTNKLRVVIAMARYFKVPVGYLLDELPESPDAATITLLGAWKSLQDKRHRDVVLQTALLLSREEP